MGFAKYIKAAFKNRWNLLAMAGGVAFGILSGQPDVVIPVVLAGEIGYLGLLGTHPKFQRHVDAQEAAEIRESKSESSEAALRRIVRSLPKEYLHRYNDLRKRCIELRQIANDLKHAGSTSKDLPLDSFQLAGLDRLLWIFLRLLFTHVQIAQFLRRTNVNTIRNDIDRLEGRLELLSDSDDSPHAQKMRRSIEDHLETSRSRLDNYSKAQANYELVGLEIDRLENKIKSLAEMAVNRQEPEFISSQVDAVADSMLETEKTMSELEFATGLGMMDEEVPGLLQPPEEEVTIKERWLRSSR